MGQVVAQALTIYNQLAVRSGDLENVDKKLVSVQILFPQNYRLNPFFLQGGIPEP